MGIDQLNVSCATIGDSSQQVVTVTELQFIDHKKILIENRRFHGQDVAPNTGNIHVWQKLSVYTRA